MACWTLAARAAGWHIDPATLGLAALGALAPDIDHPKSWVGRRLRFLSVPVSMIFGHRGITHSLLAVVACVAMMTGDGWGPGDGWGWKAAPVWIGYLSHLLADSLTPAGVPLFWPIKRTFGLALARTGSPLEWLLVGVVAFFAGAPLLSP